MATITPLFGSSAGSAFDPLAFDLTRSKKASARLLRRGDVLNHDTFSGGSFNGWRDHFAYATPRGVLGLTQYPLIDGDHALMLSTGEGPYSADSVWNSHGTYRNMSVLNNDWDLISVSGFIMLAGDGDLTAKKYPWGTVEIGLDTQWPGSTQRSFFKAYLKDGIGGTAGSTGWMLRRSDGSDVMVAGSADVFTGGNERKWNWMYVRLTISRFANGGKGGYVELQVNDTIFDLQAQFGTILAEDLILNNGSHDQFRYGLNEMFATTRSPFNTDYRYNAMVVQHPITTVNDRRAA
ncbi:hypothetical protein AB0230_01755 [Microbacterium sp. NPDC089190]|uniref:hypothetical protein n=1 Tax=Microbacterium sp. NPDC089190 TaxID=3155063 RepID=UPI00344CACC9